MINYQPDWDLNSIPPEVMISHIGRWRRRHARRAPNEKFEPCPGCEMLINARQRRAGCPWCGQKFKRV